MTKEELALVIIDRLKTPKNALLRSNKKYAKNLLIQFNKKTKLSCRR